MTKKLILDNGIRVIVDYIPQVQSVSLGFWVGTGSSKESKEYAGISHFTEHMMFKGTKKRSAKEIAQTIDGIGGQFDAFTGKEATCYYVKSMKDGVLTSADVLTDMLSNSLFDEKEMNRERNVIKEEIKMANDTPEDVVIEKAQEMVDKKTPMENSILGTPSSLNRITPEIMKAYVKDTYTKDQIVVSVSGNFDEEALMEFLNSKFKSFRGKQKVSAEQREDVIYKPGYKSIVKDIEQAHICLATKGVAMTDKRFYALNVLNNAMGGSMSSRLFQNIREEKGLAYAVHSHNSSGTSSGYFGIYAGVGHQNISLAIQGIKEELKDLHINGLTEKEVEYSKKQIVASFVYSMESTMSRMLRNGRNQLFLNKNFEPKEIIKKYESITMEDIEEAKALIDNFDSYSLCVCSSEELDAKRLMI